MKCPSVNKLTMTNLAELEPKSIIPIFSTFLLPRFRAKTALFGRFALCDIFKFL